MRSDEPPGGGGQPPGGDSLATPAGSSEAEVEAGSEDFSLHAARLGEAASLACSMSGS